MSDKIKPLHLQRKAILYIRQSSAFQVQHNQESRRLQYAMKERLEQLGWRDIEIIDDDLGCSGSGTVQRHGFERMVAEVCLGQVGAVAAREVSRFARNSREWQQLVEMCRVVDTLLIDQDTVYAPRQGNDRLLLGLKGSLNEYELDLLRARSVEARYEKARRGELLVAAPIGFIKTEDARLEKDPDRRIQEAILLAFRKGRELGSVRQTLLWFLEEGLPFPTRKGQGEVVWKRPRYSTLYRLLTNPTYGGAYAYGKSETTTRYEDGVSRRHSRRRWAWAAAVFGIRCLIASFFRPPVQDFAQTVIRIATNKGVLEIEADDEDLEITIKQPGKEPIIEVVNKKTKRAVTLTAIDGEIIVKDLLGDFQQKTTALHLTRGDKKTFHARVLLGEPVARMDAQFLQGSWLAESAEENGSPLEPEQRREIRLTFDGETVRLQSHMLGGKDLTGLYTLSPGKQPKEIVMMSQDRPAANKSWNFRGIYRFDKDRLTICLGTTDKGPIREFKTLDAESPRLLLVLRREAAFQPLFNGKDLTGWVASSPEKKEDALSAWSIEDGILKGKGRAWPVSLLHTGKDFENYVLKLQFRLPSRQRPTSGSGLILHANKGSEDRNGIHIDLRPHGDSVRIGVWKSPNSSATGIVGNTVGLIPMGEWNDLLIHSKAGTIEIWVNSKLAGKAAACTPSKGSIAFINLDSPTEYRNIEIKEMPSGPPEPGFQPLFNGKDLDGWSIVKSPGKGPEAVKATWDSAGSFVRFQSQISSCLRTSKRYQDYELKLEYRYPTPLAKSGSYQSVVILRMQDTLGWPAGIHVSLMESTTSGIEAVGVTGPYVPLSGKAKPGDWNQLSITCRGRSVSLVLNGQAIGTARGYAGQEGYIGIGLRGPNEEVHIRNVEIKELPPLDEPFRLEDRYEGEWEAYFSLREGKELSKEVLAAERMTLRGNTLVYHKNPQSELEFTLNHIAKKHTEITVTTKGPPTTVLLGIISPLRPSECRVCFGADKNRPESFDAKAGSGQKLIYFRCIGPAAPAPAFQPLFNGMDLDGWEGDTAFWRWGKGVLPKAGSGGELIGLETDPAVHNTRIWSSRTYKDFELEFDVRLRTDKQAAVIVRQTKELIGTKHDVTGFKVWLGGDTKLMGWGDAVWFRGAWTLKAKAKDAIKAVKNDDYYGSATCVGQASQPDTGCPSSSKCVSLESLTYELALSNYNRVLIRCVGKQLTVQINGVTVLDQEMKELPASGVLGFVKFVGPDVIFRNLRLREIAPSPPESAFQPLFNGMDLKGWKMIETQPFQAHQGQVKDGELIGRNKIGSWLFSDAGPFEDFHLRAEMKLVGAGDCGLHFRTQGIPFVPPPGYGVDLTVRKSPIGSLWKDGKHVKDAAKHMVAPDQWFTLEIIARGPKMKVLLNGQTVTEYTDPKWEHRKGGIALQQAHHGRFFPEENIIVHLRKIEIKDLSAGSPPGN